MEISSARRTAEVLITILVTIQYYVSNSSCSNDFEFVIEPRDLTVREGQSSSFHCTLRSRIPFVDVTSFWELGLSETVESNDQYNVTTIASLTTQTANSSLTISNVRREMDQFYKCSIMLHFKERGGRIVSSKFGRLNVQYFITERELLCRGPSSSVLRRVREGDELTFQCEGAESNPQVDLTWTWQSSNATQFQISHFQKGTILFGDIIATRLIHDSYLFCYASSRAFPDQSANCSFGPFKVIHAPIVEVIPNEAEIVWPLIAELSLQCSASGYPEVHDFDWMCQPESLFAQCTSNSQNLNILLHRILGTEILNITCTATSIEGSTQSNSVVSVRYVDEDLINDCKDNAPFFIQPTKMNPQSLHFDYTVDRLKCITKVETVRDVNFSWLLDGRLIAEEKGEYRIKEYPQGGNYIIAQNVIDAFGPGIVTCDIKVASDDSRMQLAACKMSNREMLESINHTTKSSHEVSSSCSVKVITSAEENAAEQMTYDNKTIMPTALDSSSSNDVSNGSFHFVWMVALAIALGFGLLLCAVLIVLAIQKATIRGRFQLQSHAVDSIRSNEMASSTCNVNNLDLNPVYEIPDDVSLRETAVEYIVEDEERFTGSTRSGSSSSEEDYRLSTLYEYTEQKSDYVFQHYENREIVEPTTGTVGSRYFLAKVANMSQNRNENGKQGDINNASPSVS